MPKPFWNPEQHARTWGELHWLTGGGVPVEVGFGAADAARTRERVAMMDDENCILKAVQGGKDWSLFGLIGLIGIVVVVQS